jgi:hypothetical protein
MQNDTKGEDICSLGHDANMQDLRSYVEAGALARIAHMLLPTGQLP